MPRKSQNSAHWLGAFDADLEIRPPLTEEQLCRIPSKRGVALLLGPEGEPIVLLPGANMRSRIRARLQKADDQKKGKMPDLGKVTARVLWKITCGHFETDLCYLELAAAIWPDSYGSLLAWKDAWFVHVALEDRFPHFERTRKVFESPGSYFGPLVSARLADRFIGNLQDAFDLCRDYSCGKLAPNGPTCAYAQMGKCLSPCDGTISLEDYSREVAKAVDFAAGRREAAEAELRRAMRGAAGKLNFERAAAIKAKLEKLHVLSGPSFAEVAPAEHFRFIMVQRGGSSRRAKVFLVDRGHVAEAGPLDYPLQADQIRRVLSKMAAHTHARRAWSDLCRRRMGLVARYMISSDRRRGVLLRWRPDLSASDLSEAVEGSAALLGLRPPPRRSGRPASGDS